MLTATTNSPAVTAATVIAVADAPAPEALAASAVISVVVQEVAVTVHAVQVSKAARVVMTVPHALKSRAPWLCPPG
jgi:hypothetical protein